MRAKNVHVRTGQRLTIAHMQTSDRVRNLVVVVGLHAVNQHHKGVTLESMMNCPSSLDYHHTSFLVFALDANCGEDGWGE